jgi:hypothetical protein
VSTQCKYAALTAPRLVLVEGTSFACSVGAILTRKCPADCTLTWHACGRYHYNVANSRVEQHVEKGNDDGLFISSVACCQELWALIMDAGTGFSAQVRDCPVGRWFEPQPLMWLCRAQTSGSWSGPCCL